MKIRDQIAWLRCFDDAESDQRAASNIAGTMEAMLDVVEAAKIHMDKWPVENTDHPLYVALAKLEVE